MFEMTPEKIDKSYSAALDSVALLNGEKPDYLTDELWADTIKRNVDHLKIMVAKDFWTTHDLKPLTDAIAARE